MSAFQIITALAIAVGAVVMVVCVGLTRRIRGLVSDEQQQRQWRTLNVLMVFFVAGYALAIVLVLSTLRHLLEVLTGVVFLSGAVFVYLVVRLGHGTMTTLKKHAQQEHDKAIELAKALRELEATMGKLEATNADLARSNSELEQFAYVASHDLQEPLRKVKAFGDLLASEHRDSVGEEGAMYIDRMQSAASRMSALIVDLLAFSRVTRKREAPSEVDLRAVAGEVIQDLEARIDECGGTVDVGELPTIEARPTQMRQLFQNLISNGLKFRKSDTPPVIELSATVDDDAVNLAVKDNGIGFDPKYANRIFGIFQRLHGRGEYEGTGIGLAICSKIVSGHGGTIRAEGDVGEGATFYVTLPRRQPRQPEGEPEAAARQEIGDQS
ncbi:MAG TPA: hypothetical protein ENK57_10125 [Polyangiaceae bacterium]|nr:hypothetical protein [Polyangiaceae bacterium]